jgi:uroporphyrinogen-III synthase
MPPASKKELHILFTGSQPDNYRHLGIIFHQPMIEIAGLPDYTEVDRIIRNLSHYDWICYTSKYAVEHFFNRINQQTSNTHALSGVQICSIGQVTSNCLKQYGIAPDLQAKEESSEGIIKAFIHHKITHTNILIPRSNLATEFLPEQLEKLDNIVTRLVIYENKMPEIKNHVNVESFDQVIYTSPSGVANFIKVYGALPVKPAIITRGKETRKAVDFYQNKTSKTQS